MTSPKRHKMAILTWISVYPIITTLLLVLEPLVGDLPVPVRTLILSALMVPIMAYAALPAVTRLFAGWLDDDRSQLRRRLSGYRDQRRAALNSWLIT